MQLSYSSSSSPKFSLCLLLLFLFVAAAQEEVILDAGSGLTWHIAKIDQSLWALSAPYLHGVQMEAGLMDAIAYWRNGGDGSVVKVGATTLAVNTEKTSATFGSNLELPGAGPGGVDADVAVALTLTLNANFPSATVAVAFNSSTGIAGNWQLVVKWYPDGPTTHSWLLSGYPYAGNSTNVWTKLDYMGWPGFWLYALDAGIVSFFTVSAQDDYNNPTTWTGGTEFASGDGDYRLAPQYHVPGQHLQGGRMETRTATFHLLFAQGTDTLLTAREISAALLELDHYEVKPMSFVRSPEDIFACFINARRTTPMWRQTPNGEAYQLQDIANFIYLGTTPESAYFEYLLYLQSGDALWRNRSFAQMAFWLQGQNLNASNRHYGAVQTTYDLPNGPYNSDDRGSNIGWKIDINAHMARYTLLLWEQVLLHEGVNHSDWFIAASRAAEWIVRIAAEQAADPRRPGSGGFPQRIIPSTDQPTPSVTSGRTMNALRVFHRLISDTAQYNFTDLLINAQEYLVHSIEGHLYFAGQHPDEPYYTYEQDSIWELIEYWLDVYNATRDKSALDRAIGDAYVALMMLCPKDLSWVSNPTQMAADEQTAYAQYTVYTYHNRKWLCLVRLANATGDTLFQQLASRLLQLNAFTQVTQGAPTSVGGFHEAIADPWLARGGGYDFMGSVYLNELALDFALQLLLAGTVPTHGYTGCTIGS